MQLGGEARQIQKIPAAANSREEKYKILRQYRIILSADTASEVRQLPERCLSRKAGIMRCCPYIIIKVSASFFSKKEQKLP